LLLTSDVCWTFHPAQGIIGVCGFTICQNPNNFYEQKYYRPMGGCVISIFGEFSMETNTVATPETNQPESLADIQRKTKYTGTVIKTTLAGALVDIGMDTPAVIHISQLQKEPINRVEDVVTIGQTVDVWVKRVEPKRNRIELTMIEPLDVEWREINKGMTLKGKITRIESFGIFVDVGAERPGLVHISEITHDYIKTPNDVVKEGEEVEVQVLDVNRRRKQIKLSMKALEVKPAPEPKPAKRTKAVVQEEPSEPVPTAMEIAFREAMERSDNNEEQPQVQTKTKSTKTAEEMDDIFSRTLENKVEGSK
jgi:predicted RNA-binding protein with RPS1 domain